MTLFYFVFLTGSMYLLNELDVGVRKTDVQ